jgi:uncharacterized protein YcnI
MPLSQTRRRFVALVMASAAVTVASPVQAHVESPDGDAIVAGTSAVVHFRVGHGCEGADTDRLELQLPDGIVGAKPEYLPGWTIETEMVPSEPYTLFGTEYTERVGVIRWSGGPLPDGAFFDFGIQATFLRDPGPVAIPALQGCGDAEVAWIEIAGEGQDPEALEHPAPVVTIVEGALEPDEHSPEASPEASPMG